MLDFFSCAQAHRLVLSVYRYIRLGLRRAVLFGRARPEGNMVLLQYTASMRASAANLLRNGNFHAAASYCDGFSGAQILPQLAKRGAVPGCRCDCF